MDVAVTGDRHVIKKGAERILKYKDITKEIQLNVKTEVVPVITVTTVPSVTLCTVITVTTVPSQNHPQNTSATYHQSTTSSNYSKQPYWHCTRTAGSTGVKYRTLSVGNSVTCSVNCNYRIAVTLYTVETWFVAGI